MLRIIRKLIDWGRRKKRLQFLPQDRKKKIVGPSETK